MADITLTKTKDTKNTVRFQGKDGSLDVTVYAQKSDPASQSESLTVSVNTPSA